MVAQRSTSLPTTPCITHEAIPAELRTLTRWVTWRTETRGDKPTKVPYIAGTERRAQSNNPRTWSTFETAMGAVQAGAYDGGGFMLGDGYVGLDFDGCRDPETGEIAAWARPYLDLLLHLGAYVEISPSGTGVKAIIRGVWSAPWHKRVLAEPPLGGKDKAAVEVYAAERYFTVTGQVLGAGTPAIVDAQDVLDEIAAAFAPPVKTREAASPTAGLPAAAAPVLDDHAIIDKAHAAQNGAKFAALWRGETAEYNNDHSAADEALCYMLAFWTPDAAQIDRLFRRSGLYREKWDSPRPGGTYGSITIDRALAATTEHYTPPSPEPDDQAMLDPAVDPVTLDEALALPHEELARRYITIRRELARRTVAELWQLGPAETVADAPAEETEAAPMTISPLLLAMLIRQTCAAVTLRCRYQRLLDIMRDPALKDGPKLTAMAVAARLPPVLVDPDAPPAAATLKICAETIAMDLGSARHKQKDGTMKAAKTNKVTGHLTDLEALGVYRRRKVMEHTVIRLPSRRPGHPPVEKVIPTPVYFYEPVISLPGKRMSREEAQDAAPVATADRARPRRCPGCGKRHLRAIHLICADCGTVCTVEEAEHVAETFDQQARAVEHAGRLVDPDTGEVLVPFTVASSPWIPGSGDDRDLSPWIPGSGTYGVLPPQAPAPAPLCATCGEKPLSALDLQRGYQACSWCRLATYRRAAASPPPTPSPTAHTIAAPEGPQAAAAAAAVAPDDVQPCRGCQEVWTPHGWYCARCAGGFALVEAGGRP